MYNSNNITIVQFWEGRKRQTRTQQIDILNSFFPALILLKIDFTNFKLYCEKVGTS